MAAPTIISVSPASGAVGTPVNVQVEVIFDQEIDLYRLKNGGIFLEGPDEAKSIGPGFISLFPPDTDESVYLTTAGYKGIVETNFSTIRVSGSGEEVPYYDYGDTEVAGQIYRTKAILIPVQPLKALTEYTIYVVGDEDTNDEYEFGLSTRTVFDPQKGANVGNGEIVFYGGYTGAIRQQFFLEITSSGAVGVAEYDWWTSLDPTRQMGITSLGYRLLREGVQTRFLQGLNFAAGDTFSVWCDVPVLMDGSHKASFTTSDQSPIVIPTSSTTLTGSSTTTTSTVASFSVSETSPADREALINPTLTSYTVTFGSNINATTVTDSTVTLTGMAVDGSISGSPAYTEIITKSLSITDNILTITPTTGLVFNNNIVVVTLNSSIADTDGVSLGSDYEYFFGTIMDPYFTGIRHVRLRLGSVGIYFADETVAFAIWDASRLANSYIPTTIIDAVALATAKRQFAVCYAAYILISGQSGGLGGGGVRKQLSDFDVSRNSDTGDTGGLDDILKECWESLLPIIEAGGDLTGAGLAAIQEPLVAVKGDQSVDEPHYGRLWEIPRVPIGNARVLYSGYRRWFKSNIRRS